jgi:hypothetical protein
MVSGNGLLLSISAMEGVEGVEAAPHTRMRFVV